MKKNVLLTISVFAACLFGAGFLGGISHVSAQVVDPVGNGDNTGTNTDLIPACQTGQAAGSAVCGSHNSTTTDPIAGQNGVLPIATKIMATVVGIAATIMIIVGGFRYVLSNGDAKAAESGRKTIIYALVGVVITLAASLIISFALRHIN